ncbi:hypothetical protein [Streptomyces sp. NPDC048419]|uniref:hypothetical protein n=1 Tax=Streptomyces sp. NPDC048419 TaxID=3365547 RepID=UPI0037124A50
MPAPVPPLAEAETITSPQAATTPPPEDYQSATLLDPDVWSTSSQSAPTATREDLHRYGSNIPPQAAATWHGTAPTPPRPNQQKRKRRRLLLLLLIVLSVFAFLAWQRDARPGAVTGVSVHTDGAGPHCNGTAHIIGVVETDGGASEVTYRWRRSDRTDSGVISQHVPAGRHRTELPLNWTFQGHGTMQATATLEILTPTSTSASVTFPYTCR